MTYRVVYHESFYADLKAVAEYMRSEAVGEDVIRDWFTRLLSTIDGLDEMPRRHAIDAIQTDALGTETRKLVFGNHLVFYQVDEHNHRVNVVAFIHGANRQEG